LHVINPLSFTSRQIADMMFRDGQANRLSGMKAPADRSGAERRKRDETDVYDANGVHADVLLSLYDAESSFAAVIPCG
jgi:hypothetical protein